MKRLIPRCEMNKHSLTRIESPFFASFYVDRSLLHPMEIGGLTDLISECGSSINDCLYERDKARILGKVKRGDWLLVSDDPFSPLSQDTFGKYSHLTGRSFSLAGYSLRKTESAAQFKPQAEPLTLPKGEEPGFYIVQRVMSRSELEALLFVQPNDEGLNKFKSLNHHLSNFVKPGQLVILSDPLNIQCTREDALLLEAAAKVEAALEPLSDEDAAFMARHHDEIESFLTEGSTTIGIGAAMFGQHLEKTSGTLKEIESLHQRTFQQHGKLQSSEFFSERKRLLGQLDSSLGPLIRKGIGFPEHPKLKTALGISTKSLVHHWSKAGEVGGIPGYSTHIDGVSKAAKYIKYGGVVGTVLGAGASALTVQDACRVGRENECSKVRFTESGKFVGSVAGGTAAGLLLGTGGAGAVCVVIGVGTVGIGGLVCAAVVVGAVTVVGSELGGAGGELAGSKIHEISK